jgi:putative PIN family toxin of toxin-antitoxin system
MKNDALLRVVIDTNLLITGFMSSRRAPFLILRGWSNSRFIGVISQPLLSEYEEVLERPELVSKFKLTVDESRDFLFAGAKTSEFCEFSGVPPLPLCDPDDEMVLMTAVSGKASVIVTGDKDLLSVAHDSRLGSIRIMSATDLVTEAYR